MDTVYPELTLDWASVRHPLDVQNQQFCIGSGPKVSARPLPEIRIFEILARKVCNPAIEVLHDKLWSTRALHVFCLEVEGELVVCVRLHGNHLQYPSIVHSAAIENKRERTVPRVGLGRVHGQGDLRRPLIKPIESAIQDFQAEIAIDHQ